MQRTDSVSEDSDKDLEDVAFGDILKELDRDQVKDHHQGGDEAVQETHDSDHGTAHGTREASAGGT